MMKRTTYYVISIIFLSLSYCRAQDIKNFNELVSAVKDGREVRVVIEYGKCKLVADSVEIKSPEAVGGMSLSTFEYFPAGVVKNPKGFLTSSETVLINHKKYGYVYNYVKIKIYENNEVEIIARYLKPSDLTSVMDETFYGEINNASNNKAVKLFLVK